MRSLGDLHFQQLKGAGLEVTPSIVKETPFLPIRGST